VSSPLASPSCLTPMVQHFPGGLEAIVVVCEGLLGLNGMEWFGGCEIEEEKRKRVNPDAV
jgi:hypothetical protein